MGRAVRKALIAVILIVLLVALAWVWFVGIDKVTHSRVEAALAAQGIPPTTAECMATRMVDRLSISQLRKLERLAPQEGEAATPRGFGEALTRLRRVDDPEALRITIGAGAACAIGQL